MIIGRQLQMISIGVLEVVGKRQIMICRVGRFKKVPGTPGYIFVGKLLTKIRENTARDPERRGVISVRWWFT